MTLRLIPRQSTVTLAREDFLWNSRGSVQGKPVPTDTFDGLVLADNDDRISPYVFNGDGSLVYCRQFVASLGFVTTLHAKIDLVFKFDFFMIKVQPLVAVCFVSDLGPIQALLCFKQRSG